ncbi:addiction module toxin RelE [Vreelandella titanicae]
MVHPNYIVVYRLAAGCIEIVNVLYARQEYP